MNKKSKFIILLLILLTFVTCSKKTTKEVDFTYLELEFSRTVTKSLNVLVKEDSIYYLRKTFIFGNDSLYSSRLNTNQRDTISKLLNTFQNDTSIKNTTPKSRESSFKFEIEVNNRKIEYSSNIIPDEINGLRNCINAIISENKFEGKLTKYMNINLLYLVDRNDTIDLPNILKMKLYKGLSHKKKKIFDYKIRDNVKEILFLYALNTSDELQNIDHIYLDENNNQIIIKLKTENYHLLYNL